MLKAIIVEDEASGRETLQNYLSQYCPKVTVLAACSNIKEGKSAIQQHDPDVVFLDIEMPFGNGFDLLTSLDHIRFETIFVTAYSHYAIQAIQHSASNYILKPIDIDELINAVDKVAAGRHELNTTRILLENFKNQLNQDTKIVLPVMEGLDIWILDALRRTPHPSHSHLYNSLAWIERAAPRRAILTNMHIDLDYQTVRDETPEHVEPAFDGMQLTRHL